MCVCKCTRIIAAGSFLIINYECFSNFESPPNFVPVIVDVVDLCSLHCKLIRKLTTTSVADLTGYRSPTTHSSPTRNKLNFSLHLLSWQRFNCNLQSSSRIFKNSIVSIWMFSLSMRYIVLSMYVSNRLIVYMQLFIGVCLVPNQMSSFCCVY